MHVIHTSNGQLAWPEWIKERRYNASNEPCDMLIGHCSCGACHEVHEDKVSALLRKYDIIIIADSTTPTKPTSFKTLLPGDIVKLKSGGPLMTVSYVRDGEIYCNWFCGSTLFDGHFRIEELLKAVSTCN